MYPNMPPPPVRRAGAREWLGLALLALPTVLLSMDITVLYLALPHLDVDLGPSSTEVLWIIDIYGFLIAGFLVTMGTLGDRIGRRRLLVIGAIGFTAASVVAAYATSPEMLIAARALLGVFGATLMPSTLALISNMFADSKQRAQAIAVWAACFSSGFAIGPLVGGALLEIFWWGSVFLLAVPVMGLLVLAAPFVLPEYKAPTTSRLDLVSVVLSLAGVVPIIWGIKELADDGMHWPPAAAIVAGLVFGTWFVMRQRRLAEPLFDIRLFSDRAFSTAVAALLIGVGVVGGVYLFITQFLQMVKGLEPFEAGLWMLPPAVALMITAGAAPTLIRWIRPGFLVAGGMLVSSSGYVLLLQLDPEDSVLLLTAALGVMFAGLGPVFALGTDIIVGAAPPARSGSAAAMSETAMEFGISLGIAVLGSVGAAVYRAEMDETMPAGVPSEAAEAAGETLPGAMAVAHGSPPEVGGTLTDSAFAAFTEGLHTTSIVCGITVGAFALLSFVLLRNVRTQAQRDAAAAQQPGYTHVG